MDKQLDSKTVESFSTVAAAEAPISVYAEGGFRSRFNFWIRAVSVILICIFLPDQIGWAFNYNPAVIYPQNALNYQPAPVLTSAERSSAQIAGSVGFLLNQVKGLEQARFELKLNPANALQLAKELKQPVLAIDSRRSFNELAISEITQWLAEPQVHILNCGVYALKDLLDFEGISKTPEELSVITILADLLSDVLRTGDERLKTSLFALSQAMDAFGLEYQAVKLRPENLRLLATPFIAHFKDEHFVTVLRIEGDTVYLNDIGNPGQMSISELAQRASGFALAREMKFFVKAGFERVAQNTQTFVWGDKWRNKSDELPGLVSNSQIAMQVGIQVVGALAAAWMGPGGWAAYATFSMSMAASSFAQAVGQVCQMRGGSGQSCMLLSTAISVGLTMGTSALLSAGQAAGTQAAGQALAKDGVTNASAQVSQETVNKAASEAAGAISRSGEIATQEAITSSVTKAFANQGIAVSGELGAKISAAAAANVTAKVAEASASTMASTFAAGFAQGAIIGVAKGAVEYQVVKMIDKALGDDDYILKSTVQAIASSVAGAMVGSIVQWGISNAVTAYNESSAANTDTETAAASTDTSATSTQAATTATDSAMIRLTKLDGGFNPYDLGKNSLGTVLSRTLMDRSLLAGVVGHLAAMGVRYAVSGGAVTQEEEGDLSVVLGQLGNTFGQMAGNFAMGQSKIGYDNRTPEQTVKDAKDWTALFKQAIPKAVVSAGLTYALLAMEESVIGDDDGSHSYKEKQMAFRNTAFMISGVMTGLALGLAAEYAHQDADSPVGATTSSVVEDGRLEAGYKTGYWQQQKEFQMDFWGLGAMQTLTNEMGGTPYSLNAGLAAGQLTSTMQGLTGFTPQTAWQIDKMWLATKKANSELSADNRESNSVLKLRHRIAIFDIIDPGMINIDYVNSQFSAGVVSNVIATGEIAASATFARGSIDGQQYLTDWGFQWRPAITRDIVTPDGKPTGRALVFMGATNDVNRLLDFRGVENLGLSRETDPKTGKVRESLTGTYTKEYAHATGLDKAMAGIDDLTRELNSAGVNGISAERLQAALAKNGLKGAVVSSGPDGSQKVLVDVDGKTVSLDASLLQQAGLIAPAGVDKNGKLQWKFNAGSAPGSVFSNRNAKGTVFSFSGAEVVADTSSPVYFLHKIAGLPGAPVDWARSTQPENVWKNYTVDLGARNAAMTNNPGTTFSAQQINQPGGASQSVFSLELDYAGNSGNPLQMASGYRGIKKNRAGEADRKTLSFDLTAQANPDGSAVFGERRNLSIAGLVIEPGNKSVMDLAFTSMNNVGGNNLRYNVTGVNTVTGEVFDLARFKKAFEAGIRKQEQIGLLDLFLPQMSGKTAAAWLSVMATSQALGQLTPGITAPVLMNMGIRQKGSALPEASLVSSIDGKINPLQLNTYTADGQVKDVLRVTARNTPLLQLAAGGGANNFLGNVHNVSRTFLNNHLPMGSADRFGYYYAAGTPSVGKGGGKVTQYDSQLLPMFSGDEVGLEGWLREGTVARISDGKKKGSYKGKILSDFFLVNPLDPAAGELVRLVGEIGITRAGHGQTLTAEEGKTIKNFALQQAPEGIVAVIDNNGLSPFLERAVLAYPHKGAFSPEQGGQVGDITLTTNQTGHALSKYPKLGFVFHDKAGWQLLPEQSSSSTTKDRYRRGDGAIMERLFKRTIRIFGRQTITQKDGSVTGSTIDPAISKRKVSDTGWVQMGERMIAPPPAPKPVARAAGGSGDGSQKVGAEIEYTEQSLDTAAREQVAKAKKDQGIDVPPTEQEVAAAKKSILAELNSSESVEGGGTKGEWMRFRLQQSAARKSAAAFEQGGEDNEALLAEQEAASEAGSGVFSGLDKPVTEKSLERKVKAQQTNDNTVHLKPDQGAMGSYLTGAVGAPKAEELYPEVKGSGEQTAKTGSQWKKAKTEQVSLAIEANGVVTPGAITFEATTYLGRKGAAGQAAEQINVCVQTNCKAVETPYQAAYDAKTGQWLLTGVDGKGVYGISTPLGGVKPQEGNSTQVAGNGLDGRVTLRRFVGLDANGQAIYMMTLDSQTPGPNSNIQIAETGKQAVPDGMQVNNNQVSLQAPAVGVGNGFITFKEDRKTGQVTFQDNNMYYAVDMAKNQNGIELWHNDSRTPGGQVLTLDPQYNVDGSGQYNAVLKQGSQLTIADGSYGKVIGSSSVDGEGMDFRQGIFAGGNLHFVNNLKSGIMSLSADPNQFYIDKTGDGMVLNRNGQSINGALWQTSKSGASSWLSFDRAEFGSKTDPSLFGTPVRLGVPDQEGKAIAVNSPELIKVQSSESVAELSAKATYDAAHAEVQKLQAQLSQPGSILFEGDVPVAREAVAAQLANALTKEGSARKAYAVAAEQRSAKEANASGKGAETEFINQTMGEKAQDPAAQETARLYKDEGSDQVWATGELSFVLGELNTTTPAAWGVFRGQMTDQEIADKTGLQITPEFSAERKAFEDELAKNGEVSQEDFARIAPHWSEIFKDETQRRKLASADSHLDQFVNNGNVTPLTYMNSDSLYTYVSGKSSVEGIKDATAVYDKSGQLTGYTDRDGRMVTFTNAIPLIKLVDPTGEKVYSQTVLYGGSFKGGENRQLLEGAVAGQMDYLTGSGLSKAPLEQQFIQLKDGKRFITQIKWSELGMDEAGPDRPLGLAVNVNNLSLGLQNQLQGNLSGISPVSLSDQAKGMLAYRDKEGHERIVAFPAMERGSNTDIMSTNIMAFNPGDVLSINHFAPKFVNLSAKDAPYDQAQQVISIPESQLKAVNIGQDFSFQAAPPNLSGAKSGTVNQGANEASATSDSVESRRTQMQGQDLASVYAIDSKGTVTAGPDTTQAIEFNTGEKLIGRVGFQIGTINQGGVPVLSKEIQFAGQAPGSVVGWKGTDAELKSITGERIAQFKTPDGKTNVTPYIGGWVYKGEGHVDFFADRGRAQTEISQGKSVLRVVESVPGYLMVVPVQYSFDLSKPKIAGKEFVIDAKTGQKLTQSVGQVGTDHGLFYVTTDKFIKEYEGFTFFEGQSLPAIRRWLMKDNGIVADIRTLLGKPRAGMDYQDAYDYSTFSTWKGLKGLAAGYGVAQYLGWTAVSAGIGGAVGGYANDWDRAAIFEGTLNGGVDGAALGGVVGIGGGVLQAAAKAGYVQKLQSLSPAVKMGASSVGWGSYGVGQGMFSNYMAGKDITDGNWKEWTSRFVIGAATGAAGRGLSATRSPALNAVAGNVYTKSLVTTVAGGAAARSFEEGGKGNSAGTFLFDVGSGVVGAFAISGAGVWGRSILGQTAGKTVSAPASSVWYDSWAASSNLFKSSVGKTTAKSVSLAERGAAAVRPYTAPVGNFFDANPAVRQFVMPFSGKNYNTALGEIRGLAGAGKMSYLEYSAKVSKLAASGVLGGSTWGGVAGYALSYGNPNELTSEQRMGYAAYGAFAGGALALLVAARPAMQNWSRTTPEGRTLEKVDITNFTPNMAGRMALTGATDFALMMPAWNIVTVPVHAAAEKLLGKSENWKEAWKSSDIRFRTGMDGSLIDPTDLLARKAPGDMLSGAQMGVMLGPTMGLLQKPLSAVTRNENGFWGKFWKGENLAGKLTPFAGHSMPRTIATLSFVEVGTEQAMHAFGQGRIDRWGQEGMAKVEKLMALDQVSRELELQRLGDSGLKTFFDTGDFSADAVRNYGISYAEGQVAALASNVAFASLFFKPTASPRPVDYRAQRIAAAKELRAARKEVETAETAWRAAPTDSQKITAHAAAIGKVERAKQKIFRANASEAAVELSKFRTGTGDEGKADGKTKNVEAIETKYNKSINLAEASARRASWAQTVSTLAENGVVKFDIDLQSQADKALAEVNNRQAEYSQNASPENKAQVDNALINFSKLQKQINRAEYEAKEIVLKARIKKGEGAAPSALKKDAQKAQVELALLPLERLLAPRIAVVDQRIATKRAQRDGLVREGIEAAERETSPDNKTAETSGSTRVEPPESVETPAQAALRQERIQALDHEIAVQEGVRDRLVTMMEKWIAPLVESRKQAGETSPTGGINSKIVREAVEDHLANDPLERSQLETSAGRLEGSSGKKVEAGSKEYGEAVEAAQILARHNLRTVERQRDSRSEEWVADEQLQRAQRELAEVEKELGSATASSADTRVDTKDSVPQTADTDVVKALQQRKADLNTEISRLEAFLQENSSSAQPKEIAQLKREHRQAVAAAEVADKHRALHESGQTAEKVLKSQEAGGKRWYASAEGFVRRHKALLTLEQRKLASKELELAQAKQKLENSLQAPEQAETKEKIEALEKDVFNLQKLMLAHESRLGWAEFFAGARAKGQINPLEFLSLKGKIERIEHDPSYSREQAEDLASKKQELDKFEATVKALEAAKESYEKGENVDAAASLQKAAENDPGLREVFPELFKTSKPSAPEQSEAVEQPKPAEAEASRQQATPAQQQQARPQGDLAARQKEQAAQLEAMRQRQASSSGKTSVAAEKPTAEKPEAPAKVELSESVSESVRAEGQSKETIELPENIPWSQVQQNVLERMAQVAGLKEGSTLEGSKDRLDKDIAGHTQSVGTHYDLALRQYEVEIAGNKALTTGERKARLDLVRSELAFQREHMLRLFQAERTPLEEARFEASEYKLDVQAAKWELNRPQDIHLSGEGHLSAFDQMRDEARTELDKIDVPDLSALLEHRAAPRVITRRMVGAKGLDWKKFVDALPQEGVERDAHQTDQVTLTKDFDRTKTGGYLKGKDAAEVVLNRSLDPKEVEVKVEQTLNRLREVKERVAAMRVVGDMVREMADARELKGTALYLVKAAEATAVRIDLRKRYDNLFLELRDDYRIPLKDLTPEQQLAVVKFNKYVFGESGDYLTPKEFVGRVRDVQESVLSILQDQAKGFGEGAENIVGELSRIEARIQEVGNEIDLAYSLAVLSHARTDKSATPAIEDLLRQVEHSKDVPIDQQTIDNIKEQAGSILPSAKEVAVSTEKEPFAKRALDYLGQGSQQQKDQAIFAVTKRLTTLEKTVETAQERSRLRRDLEPLRRAVTVLQTQEYIRHDIFRKLEAARTNNSTREQEIDLIEREAKRMTYIDTDVFRSLEMGRPGERAFMDYLMLTELFRNPEIKTPKELEAALKKKLSGDENLKPDRIEQELTQGDNQNRLQITLDVFNQHKNTAPIKALNQMLKDLNRTHTSVTDGFRSALSRREGLSPEGEAGNIVDKRIREAQEQIESMLEIMYAKDFELDRGAEITETLRTDNSGVTEMKRRFVMAEGIAQQAIGLPGTVVVKGTGGGKTLIQLMGVELSHIVSGRQGATTTIITPEPANMIDYMKRVNELYGKAKGQGETDHKTRYFAVSEGKVYRFDGENGVNKDGWKLVTRGGKPVEAREFEMTDKKEGESAVVMMTSRDAYDMRIQPDSKGYEFLKSMKEGKNEVIMDDIQEMTRGSGLVLGGAYSVKELIANGGRAEADEIRGAAQMAAQVYNLTKNYLSERSLSTAFERVDAQLVDHIKSQVFGNGVGRLPYSETSEKRVYEFIDAAWRHFRRVKGSDYHEVVVDEKTKSTAYVVRVKDVRGERGVELTWEGENHQGPRTQRFEKEEDFYSFLKQNAEAMTLGYSKGFVLADRSVATKDHIFHDPADAAICSVAVGADLRVTADYLVRPKKALSADIFKVASLVGAERITFYSASPDLDAIKEMGLDVTFSRDGGMRQRGDLVLVGRAPELKQGQLEFRYGRGREMLTEAVQQIVRDIRADPFTVQRRAGERVVAVKVGVLVLDRADYAHEAREAALAATRHDPYQHVVEVTFTGDRKQSIIAAQARLQEVAAGYFTKDMFERVGPKDQTWEQFVEDCLGKNIILRDPDKVDPNTRANTETLQDFVTAGKIRFTTDAATHPKVSREIQTIIEKSSKQKIIVVLPKFEAGSNLLEFFSDKGERILFGASIRHVGRMEDSTFYLQLVGRGTDNYKETETNRAYLLGGKMTTYVDTARMSATQREAFRAAENKEEKLWELAHTYERELGVQAAHRARYSLLDLKLDGYGLETKLSDTERNQQAHYDKIILEKGEMYRGFSSFYLPERNTQSVRWSVLDRMDLAEEGVSYRAWQDSFRPFRETQSGTQLVRELVSQQAVSSEDLDRLMFTRDQSGRITDSPVFEIGRNGGLTGNTTMVGTVAMRILQDEHHGGQPATRNDLEGILNRARQEVTSYISAGAKLEQGTDGELMWVKRDDEGLYMDVIPAGTKRYKVNAADTQEFQVVERYNYNPAGQGAYWAKSFLALPSGAPAQGLTVHGTIIPDGAQVDQSGQYVLTQNFSHPDQPNVLALLVNGQMIVKEKGELSKEDVEAAGGDWEQIKEKLTQAKERLADIKEDTIIFDSAVTAEKAQALLLDMSATQPLRRVIQAAVEGYYQLNAHLPRERLAAIVGENNVGVLETALQQAGLVDAAGTVQEKKKVVLEKDEPAQSWTALMPSRMPSRVNTAEDEKDRAQKAEKRARDLAVALNLPRSYHEHALAILESLRDSLEIDIPLRQFVSGTERLQAPDGIVRLSAETMDRRVIDVSLQSQTARREGQLRQQAGERGDLDAVRAHTRNINRSLAGILKYRAGLSLAPTVTKEIFKDIKDAAVNKDALIQALRAAGYIDDKGFLKDDSFFAVKTAADLNIGLDLKDEDKDKVFEALVKAETIRINIDRGLSRSEYTLEDFDGKQEKAQALLDQIRRDSSISAPTPQDGHPAEDPVAALNQLLSDQTGSAFLPQKDSVTPLEVRRAIKAKYEKLAPEDRDLGQDKDELTIRLLRTLGSKVRDVKGDLVPLSQIRQLEMDFSLLDDGQAAQATNSSIKLGLDAFLTALADNNKSGFRFVRHEGMHVWDRNLSRHKLEARRIAGKVDVIPRSARIRFEDYKVFQTDTLRARLNENKVGILSDPFAFIRDMETLGYVRKEKDHYIKTDKFYQETNGMVFKKLPGYDTQEQRKFVFELLNNGEEIGIYDKDFALGEVFTQRKEGRDYLQELSRAMEQGDMQEVRRMSAIVEDNFQRSREMAYRFYGGYQKFLSQLKGETRQADWKVEAETGSGENILLVPVTEHASLRIPVGNKTLEDINSPANRENLQTLVQNELVELEHLTAEMDAYLQLAKKHATDRFLYTVLNRARLSKNLDQTVPVAGEKDASSTFKLRIVAGILSSDFMKKEAATKDGKAVTIYSNPKTGWRMHVDQKTGLIHRFDRTPGVSEDAVGDGFEKDLPKALENARLSKPGEKPAAPAKPSVSSVVKKPEPVVPPAAGAAPPKPPEPSVVPVVLPAALLAAAAPLVANMPPASAAVVAETPAVNVAGMNTDSEEKRRAVIRPQISSERGALVINVRPELVDVYREKQAYWEQVAGRPVIIRGIPVTGDTGAGRRDKPDQDAAMEPVKTVSGQDRWDPQTRAQVAEGRARVESDQRELLARAKDRTRIVRADLGRAIRSGRQYPVAIHDALLYSGTSLAQASRAYRGLSPLSFDQAQAPDRFIDRAMNSRFAPSRYGSCVRTSASSTQVLDKTWLEYYMKKFAADPQGLYAWIFKVANGSTLDPEVIPMLKKISVIKDAVVRALLGVDMKKTPADKIEGRMQGIEAVLKVFFPNGIPKDVLDAMNGIKASTGMEVEGGKVYRVKTLNASLAAAVRRYRRNVRTHGRRDAKWTREFLVVWLKQWKGRGLSLQGDGLEAYVVTNNPNYEKKYQTGLELDETEAKYRADLLKMKTRLAEGKITQTQFNNWKALQKDLRQKGVNEQARRTRDEALYPWNKAGADAGRSQPANVEAEPVAVFPVIPIPPAVVPDRQVPVMRATVNRMDAIDEERSQYIERLASGQIKAQPRPKEVPKSVVTEEPIRKRVTGLARFFDILPLSMQKKRPEPVVRKPVPAVTGRRDVPLTPVQGPFIRQSDSDVMLVREPVLLKDDKKGNVLSAIVGVFAPQPAEDTDQDQGPGPMTPVPPGPVVPVVYPFSGLIPKGGSPDPHPGPHGKTPSGGANPPQPPTVP